MADNDVSKSIRVGTVDFFGIMIPGLLLIAMCGIGFFVPLGLLIMHFSNSDIMTINLDTNGTLLILFLLVIFSYVLGYILRLSSPDQLDRKSAIKVIRREYVKSLYNKTPITLWEQISSMKNMPNVFMGWFRSVVVSWNSVKEWIKDDQWPFDPSNPRDKYPYLNFKNYLLCRSHDELAELIHWEPEEEEASKDDQPAKKLSRKPSDNSTTDPKHRSKSSVNKMKLSIRFYCPDLFTLIESKEAHIRLMAGTWTALRFSQWAISIALIILAVVEFMPQWVDPILPAPQLSGNNYFVYIFINLSLLWIIFFCNRRIENLFHYRRVSELFHIVQAAYFVTEQSMSKGKQSKR